MSDLGGILDGMTGEGRANYWPGSEEEMIPMAEAAREAPAADREGQRLTKPETPIPVRVWVDGNRSRYQLVQGWAIAWTTRQVQVRYLDQHDREGRAWVRANAVTRTEHVRGG